MVTSRGMTEAVETAVQQEQVARAVAVELDFASAPVRLTSATVPLVIGGETYLAVGQLGEIAAAEESTELKAGQITLALSGVPNDAIAASVTEPYQGRRCTCYEAVLDPETGELLDDPVIFFRGRISQMNVELGQTARVQLVVENRLSGWDRPRLRRWTDEDQQRAHPGDRALEFVSATAEQEIVWPSRSFRG